jgi:hypothetical protein
LGELTRHHGEVDIELFCLIELAAVGRVMRHLRKLHPLELQFLVQDKGDPIVERRREKSAQYSSWRGKSRDFMAWQEPRLHGVAGAATSWRGRSRDLMGAARTVKSCRGKNCGLR